MSPALAILEGGSPIVLVAPHGGRRDAGRRPWGGEALKMNDLHTGELARELAGRLDASAVESGSVTCSCPTTSAKVAGRYLR